MSYCLLCNHEIGNNIDYYNSSGIINKIMCIRCNICSLCHININDHFIKVNDNKSKEKIFTYKDNDKW